MRLRPDQLRGFYSVLDRPSRDLALALVASSRILQVRVKPGTAAERLEVATMAREVTAMVNALLIINDDIELAHRVSADGVHLGQTDMSIEEVRVRSDILVGISTHNIEQVKTALAQGADYVGFGPVFATKTKADPDPVVGTVALAEAVALAGDTPVVAIGGITPDNIAEIHRAEAPAACVISAVNNAKNPRTAARAIAAPWGMVK